MKKLNALSKNNAPETTKPLFEGIEKKIGKLPNIYAAMGHSPHLLKGLLDFETTLKQGIFNAKEQEAISLVVSQINGCSYCLAAHSFIGKMNGFKEDEIMAIRKTIIDDEKLSALTLLTKELSQNRGKGTEETITQFYSVGYNKQALVELIGLIAVRTITNSIFSNGDFEIDFPLASELELTI